MRRKRGGPELPFWPENGRLQRAARCKLRAVGWGWAIGGRAPDSLVEIGGRAARDGDGGPVVAGEDAGDQDDLADMVSAIGERALDGEGHGVAL